MGYRITQQTAGDLKKIWCYGASNYGESQADQYVEKLKSGCERIAENPTIWRAISLAGNGVRVYHCKHHYIFYLTDDADVAIIALLHERMDFISRLKTRLKS